MRITRKQTYSALAGVGILFGAAGLASAATGGSTPVDPAPAVADTDDVQDEDGVDDENEADENEADEQEADYTSSITVADDESAVEVDEPSQLAPLATITADEAGRAALISQPGTVTEVQLENENGNVVYGVLVDTGNGTVDVKVDAGDGSILASEADDGDEDGDEEQGVDDGEEQDDSAPDTGLADD